MAGAGVAVTATGDAARVAGGGSAALPWRRWVALLALLLAEGLALGIGFDSDALDALPPGWTTLLAQNAGSAVRVGAVVFASLFLVAAARLRRGPSAAFAARAMAHRYQPYLVGHLASFGALVMLSVVLFGGDMVPDDPGRLVGAWLLVLVLTLASWAATIVPPSLLPALARSYAPTLGLALVLGLGAAGVGKLAQGLWLPLRRVTFVLSSVLLRGFVRDVVVDPDQLAFGTRGFIVDIAPTCSGYEGVGLTWVFLLAALWLFRDRLRFPRAFWLLAIGTVVPFATNVVRLVALVLVGAFISPEIGAGGFHSYAGTLLFCGVALSIVAVALRSPWLTRAATTGARPAAGERAANPAAPYLVPFLSLVVAGLVSRAFSVEGREPLYAVRPLLGIATLAVYASAYRSPAWRPQWRVSWVAAPVGVLAAVMWWGLDRLFPLAPAAGATVAAPPPGLLSGGLRALTTLAVVPIAEELAFRGFLARRVSGPAFDDLPPQALGWAGIAVSSLAFGLLHRRPVAGVLAGICYALVFRRRGRLADAIVAHAVTNAVLMIVAWATGDWGLWM